MGQKLCFTRTGSARGMAARLLLLVSCFLFLDGLAHAEISEKTLPNGLKVIVKPDHRAPVVVSQIWYRAGSMDEQDGVTGVAHVLEHMMFKGTVDVPAGEFSKRIAAAGGRENAFTSRDHTAYFQQLEKSRLELALQLEADRMRNLVLSADEFAKEIQVVMEERRMRTEDNPQSQVYERMMATVFQAHPYRRPIIGWMSDLENMTVQDAKAWYERWYAPNNAVLVVVGDVDPETVFSLAERWFGALSGPVQLARKPLSEPAQAGVKRISVKAPAKLPYLLMAWHAPTLVKAEDWEPYALQVLSGVLDGNSSARLPQSLVKDQRVAVEVGVGYDAVARGPGLFLVDATPSEGRSAGEVEAAVRKEIDRIREEGVTEEELARVKAQVIAADVFQRDSMFYQAMLIGEYETAGLGYRALDDRVSRLRAVTAEQVKAVAQKYLNEDNLSAAVLDPQPIATEQPRRRVTGGRHG
jgi:zinc protease